MPNKMIMAIEIVAAIKIAGAGSVTEIRKIGVARKKRTGCLLVMISGKLVIHECAISF